MAAAKSPFKDYWASTVHRAIKDDYERLLGTTPKRIAEKEKAKAGKKEKKKGKREEDEAPQQNDAVRAKITSVIEEVREKGERRNAYMNLAWTGPIDNSFLSEKISLGKVENMAADMFLRSLPTGAAAAETAPDSQEAADDAEASTQSNVELWAVETLSQTGKRPWQIPERVEKGFEIPIMIVSSLTEPVIGKFKRLGMDVVVNAV